MNNKCIRCGKELMTLTAIYGHSECAECEQRDRDQRTSSEESSRQLTNLAMGDMMGTGIPGGIDCDFSTPL